MNRVFIADGLRTHIGIRNGIFKEIRPELLGAEVLKGLGERQDLREMDQVICGNAVGPGGNIGRLTVLEAGLPEEIPAMTADLQCASGLAGIDIAFAKIASGQCSLIAAGGIESTSLQPHRLYHENDPRRGEGNGEYLSAQFIPGEYSDNAMIRGAERTAAGEQITREEADAAALDSQQKAMEASRQGYLKDVILPVFGSVRDEAIRPRITGKVFRRAPVISGMPDGIMTSANVCTINDGAAFLLLCSEAWMKEHHIMPMAEILGTETIGTDAARPPLSADRSTGRLLSDAHMTYEEVDAFEYNEAFSIIDVLFTRAHPGMAERYNSLGGALAYGHPYGASGAVILLHLMTALKLRQGKIGVAAIAAAGGVGVSMLIRSLQS